MKNLLIALLFLTPMKCCAIDQKHHTVVCVHGFLGSDWNMAFFKKHLTRSGWNVIVWDYPSRDATINEHARALLQELQDIVKASPGDPICFVAHSMGSLVLRAALNDPLCPIEAKIGRIVLLTPLNQGSSLAKQMHEFYLGKLLLKNYAGKELAIYRDFQSIGNFPETTKVLVIAGRLGWNPFLKEKNDGTLAVTETILSTPHEYIELLVGHASVLLSKQALRLTKNFLNAK